MRSITLAHCIVAAFFIALIALAHFQSEQPAPPGKRNIEAASLVTGSPLATTDKVANFSSVKLRPYLPATFDTTKSCDFGAAKSDDGDLRLALLVGVGQYLSPKVNDLSGPPRDVEKIYNLLTAKNGYGFPEENVCVLLNEAATRQNFIDAFQRGLLENVKDGAKIIIFFAGHGSQEIDKNGDEIDRMDETWLFHDVATRNADGVFSRPLVDDEFAVLMDALKARAVDLNITVILDSCHSGTAARSGAGAPALQAIRAGPTTEELFENGAPPLEFAVDDYSDDDWTKKNRTDQSTYTVLAAAGDGTVAIETLDSNDPNGARSGVFTDALYLAMSRAAASPLTYADIEAEVRSRVKARSYQTPRFYGDLQANIFSAQGSRKPLSWRVLGIQADRVTLGSGPQPGAGLKAVFRIYDRATPENDFDNPEASKAQVQLIATNGVTGTASIFSIQEGATIEEGDFAVLVNVSAEYRRTSFRLRPKQEQRGLTENLRDALVSAVQTDLTAGELFDLTEERAAFELIDNGRGELQIVDSQYHVRNTFKSPEEKVAQILSVMKAHARQTAIRQLSGESGPLKDQASLKVTIEPRPDLRLKGDNYFCKSEISVPAWSAKNNNTSETVPLCAVYDVWVERTDSLPQKLQVGGLHLVADGQIFALPQREFTQGQPVFLAKKGERVQLARLQALPPIDIEESFMVFGVHEDTPVDWARYSTDFGAQLRGDSAPNPLVRAFDEYVEFETRSKPVGVATEDRAYTLTSLQLRTIANAGCAMPGGEGCREDAPGGVREGTREYTINAFDVRPYLPDDQTSSLYKVLKKADCLSKYSVKRGECSDELTPTNDDGVGYKQHDWSAPSDKENLEIGIDCSRSIWYAFTRAGLRYNRIDRYLPTADMVADTSWMKDEFDQCTGDYRTGDIIVYRDEVRGVGHVVMVIDVERRIAWGSHGWDGNIRLGEESDTGVEYQLIRYKKDWAAWDRTSMSRKACWRYKDFSEEHDSGKSAPGQIALSSICKNPSDCGVR